MNLKNKQEAQKGSVFANRVKSRHPGIIQQRRSYDKGLKVTKEMKGIFVPCESSTRQLGVEDVILPHGEECRRGKAIN